LRNRILMGAVEEMKNRGVKFTMSNLAKRLNLSKTSLYEHFSSKNELVHNIIITALDDIHKQEQVIYNNTELSVPEKIEAFLKLTPIVFGPINSYSLYDDLRHYYPHEWQLVSVFQESQQNRLAAFITQNVENNTLRPINLTIFKRIVLCMTNDLFNFQFLSENNITHSDALAAMSDITVYGLLPKTKD